MADDDQRCRLGPAYRRNRDGSIEGDEATGVLHCERQQVRVGQHAGAWWVWSFVKERPQGSHAQFVTKLVHEIVGHHRTPRRERAETMQVAGRLGCCMARLDLLGRGENVAVDVERGLHDSFPHRDRLGGF